MAPLKNLRKITLPVGAAVTDETVKAVSGFSKLREINFNWEPVGRGVTNRDYNSRHRLEFGLIGGNQRLNDVGVMRLTALKNITAPILSMLPIG